MPEPNDPGKQLRPVVQFPSPDPKDNPLPASLTKETLPDYQEGLLVKNARVILPVLFKSLRSRLQQGDSKAADQVMTLYGYSKPGTVINNMIGNNISQSSDSGVYFEKIIRMLESNDRGSREDLEEDVMDAEVINEANS